ncbi:Aspartic peptidase family and Aspartic peptidase domain-containing protein [Aphelenchoides besseyi]|nr:Aspartic peptidase family and Aspartic peptidase domain-containing protein [Aphelenchoides besseyi]
MKLQNEQDVIFRTTINVGNPMQKFEAVFHTGCIFTRFPKVGCTSTGRFKQTVCKQNTYNPDKSTTAIRGQTYSMPESDFTYFGSSGVNYTETLRFGETKNNQMFVIPRQSIGASTNLWKFDHAAFCVAPSYSWFKSSFREMVDQQLLSRPIMVTALKSCKKNCHSIDDGGVVTFGQYDTKNCQAHTVTSAQASLSSWKWEFKMNSFAMNGKPISIPNAILMLNTGNSYLNIPNTLMPRVINELKAEKHNGFLTVDCNSKFSFSFAFGNSLPLALDQDHLILKHQNISGRCVLAINENKDPKHVFVLGAAFHRKYCVVHEMDKRRAVFTLNKY